MGYYVDDPNGGPPQYHEGFDPAQGQQSTGPGHHGNILTTYLKTQGQVMDPRKSALPYVLPYAMWAGGLGAGASAANAILNNPGSTLLPGSLAASTAVPLGQAGLLAGVAGAGATAAAGATPAAVAGGASAGGVGAGTAGLGAGGAGAGAGAAGAGGAGAGAGTAGTVAGGGAAAVGKGLLSRFGDKALDEAAKALQGFGASQTHNRDADLSNQRDYEDQQLAQTRQQNESALTDLQQRKYLSDEAQRNRGNAVHGGYLAGVQDVNITPPEGIHMANMTGGLRPSAIQGKEQMGNTIQAQAMRDLLNPQALPPVGQLPPAPQAPKGAGAVERGTSIAGAILPWLSPFLPKPKTTTPANTVTPTPLGLNPMQGTSFRY